MRKASSEKEFLVSVLESSSSFDFESHVAFIAESFNAESFSGETWVISSNLDVKILDRLKVKFKTLSQSINGEANYGIKSGLTDAFIIDEQKRNEIVKNDPRAAEIIHPVLRGRDIIP
mgnify:CR=1 FL=1